MKAEPKQRIFISMLGTGNYKNVPYYYENEEETFETPYAQEVILKHVLKEKPDKCLIILTEEAREKHWKKEWEKDWEEFKKTHQEKCGEIYWAKYWETYQEKYGEGFGLASRLQGFNVVEIDTSIEPQKLWNLIEDISREVPENSQLILDVTHSFRYMPMFLLVLADYLRVLKNVSIENVFYAQFEAKGQKKPVLSLLPLIKLQEWTRAVSVFAEYGRAELLGEKVEEVEKMLERNIKNASGKEEKNSIIAVKYAMGKLKSVNAVSLQIATCRGDKILKQGVQEPLKKLETLREQSELLKNYEDKEVLVTLSLLEIVERKLRKLEKEDEDLDSVRMLKAARWAYDHKMYQQAITFLEEGLTSWLMEKTRLGGEEVLDREKRGIFNSALLSFVKDKNHSDQEREEEKEQKQKQEEEQKQKYKEILLGEFAEEQIKEVASLVDNIKNERNKINHAFMRKEKQKKKFMRS